MTTRAAVTGDAAAIATIWNRYIRDTAVTFTSEEKTTAGIAADIAARQGGGMAFLVTGPAGRLAGFATSHPFRAGPGYQHTLEVTVMLAPEARGQGRGRALLAGLERAARGGGIHVLVAGISGENPAACDFFAAAGFSPAGRIAQAGRKFGRWMDLVVMQKTL